MSLFFHELSHLILSLIPGYIIWKIFNLKNKKYLLFFLLAGLIGGLFIDFDHLFDYFLAFGFRFRLDYFFKGYQFLKSDKIYIPFHSYELIFFIFLTSIIFWYLSLRTKRSNPVKNNFFFISLLAFTLALSMIFHIFFDIIENELPPSTYSFIYRINKNFKLKDLVYPDHYRYHLEQKKKVKL